MGKFIDMTGQVYNDWMILERDFNKKSSKIYWICKCLKCGNIKSVLGSDIRANKSTNCGCRKKEKLILRNKNNAKNITNKQYGYLLALEPTEKRQNTYVVWKCKCLKCNQIIEATLHDLEKGSIQSCGCMTESHDELMIKKILDENNIPFKTEITFQSCRFPDTNALARFDFYVNNQYLIEFDGSQHFSFMTYNNCKWNNEKSFEKTKFRDSYKNQWCKENNIPLIRIPYTKLKTLTIEDLVLETTTYQI